MMKIAISGLTGSGKNTLGEVLSKKTSYPIIAPTFKELAEKEGMSLMEFQKKAKNNPEIDKKFDELLKKKAEQKNDCIVTTWLGPWVIDAEVRIKLFAPLKARAERIAKRDKMKFENALDHVKKRDRENIERYKNVYDIDIEDNRIFDACLNSDIFSPQELAEIVLEIKNQK